MLSQHYRRVLILAILIGITIVPLGAELAGKYLLVGFEGEFFGEEDIGMWGWIIERRDLGYYMAWGRVVHGNLVPVPDSGYPDETWHTWYPIERVGNGYYMKQELDGLLLVTWQFGTDFKQAIDEISGKAKKKEVVAAEPPANEFWFTVDAGGTSARMVEGVGPFDTAKSETTLRLDRLPLPPRQIANE